MKQFTIIFLLLLFYAKAYSGTCIIRGEVKKSATGFAVVNRPVNGFFNRIAIDKSDTVALIDCKFSVRINCDKPVFVNIFVDNNPINFIVQPNDSICFTMDLSVKNAKRQIPCSFSGSNADGQKIFYYYNYWPVVKYENIWKALKGDSSLIISSVKKEIGLQLTPFRVLYLNKKIDAAYYELVAATISTLLLHEATRKVTDENIRELTLSTAYRRKVAESLFREFDPKSKILCYGLNTWLYANGYFNYLRAKSLNIPGGCQLPDTTIVRANKAYKITGDFVALFVDSSNKFREFLLASLIIGYLQTVGVEESFFDELPLFYAYYPNSIFSTIIRNFKHQKVLEKKAMNSENRFFTATAINILDTVGSITNFHFVSDSLKDKLVFVDIWATWCGPCMKEMQFNYEIDSFLYQNDMKRLYISIDDQSQKQRWRSTIEKMHLGGYHILAGNEMGKFLTMELGVGGGIIAIPRYVIMRNGKILEKEAYSPAEFEKLKDQLNKYRIANG